MRWLFKVFGFVFTLFVLVSVPVMADFNFRDDADFNNAYGIKRANNVSGENFTVGEMLCLVGDCRSVWPSGGGGGIVTVESSDNYIIVQNGTTSTFSFNDTLLNETIDSRDTDTNVTTACPSGDTLLESDGDCIATPVDTDTHVSLESPDGSINISQNSTHANLSLNDTAAVEAVDTAYPNLDTDSTDDVTDHGALTGLSDDDHPQYLNQARFDSNTSGWDTDSSDDYTSNDFDTDFNSKTTDDLSEGSTNLYDNRSWNQTTGDEEYVNVDGDSMNGGLGATTITSEELNITSSEPSLFFNDSGLAWKIQMQTSGNILNFVSPNQASILQLNNNEGRAEIHNTILKASSAGSIPAIIRAASGQTESIMEWQNSSESVLASVNATGSFIVRDLPLGWSNLTSYPSACPAGSAVTTLGDSVTCTTFLQNIVEDTTPQLGGELDAQGNNIIDLADVTFRTGASGGTLRTGTSNADKFVLQGYDVNDATYRTLIEADAGNEVTLQAIADWWHFEDATDTSKRFDLNLSEASTGTTTTFHFVQSADREITVPNASGTLALLSDITSHITSLPAENITAGDFGGGTFTYSGSEICTGSNGLCNQTNPVNRTGDINDSNTLFIDESTQRVGIGTSSPGKELEVNGEIKVTGGGFSQMGGSGHFTIFNHDSNIVQANPNVPGGGNVNHMIQMFDTAPRGLAMVRYANNSGAIGGIVMGKSRGTSIGASGAVLANDPMGSLTFSADDGNDMFTIPAQIEGVVGSGISPTTNRVPGAIVFKTASASADDDLTEVVRIDKDGNVGIGTASPAVKLEVEDTSVDGNIFRLQDSDGTCDQNPESGSITTSCSSDERLKKNIREVNKTAVLEELRAWTTCMREYEVISSNDTKIGSIAQCLLEKKPELVSNYTTIVNESGNLSNVTYYKVEQPDPNRLLIASAELYKQNKKQESRISENERIIRELCKIAPEGTCA